MMWEKVLEKTTYGRVNRVEYFQRKKSKKDSIRERDLRRGAVSFLAFEALVSELCGRILSSLVSDDAVGFGFGVDWTTRSGKTG